MYSKGYASVPTYTTTTTARAKVMVDYPSSNGSANVFFCLQYYLDCILRRYFPGINK